MLQCLLDVYFLSIDDLQREFRDCVPEMGAHMMDQEDIIILQDRCSVLMIMPMPLSMFMVMSMFMSMFMFMFKSMVTLMPLTLSVFMLVFMMVRMFTECLFHDLTLLYLGHTDERRPSGPLGNVNPVICGNGYFHVLSFPCHFSIKIHIMSHN